MTDNSNADDSSGMDLSFTVMGLILLTTAVAIFHTALTQVGFGDAYYASSVATEVRRFGFSLALAFAAFGVFALLKSPTHPGHWVGVRVLSALAAVVLLQHFYFPDAQLLPRHSPPQLYTKLWYLIPIALLCTTAAAAIYSARFNAFWTAGLLLSMLTEVLLSLILMIVAREPEALWEMYRHIQQYELLILSVGVISGALLSYLSILERKGVAGVFSSLIFISIPCGAGLYEWAAF